MTREHVLNAEPKTGLTMSYSTNLTFLKNYKFEKIVSHIEGVRTNWLNEMFCLIWKNSINYVVPKKCHLLNEKHSNSVKKFP